jgi:hypothetical protein
MSDLTYEESEAMAEEAMRGLHEAIGETIDILDRVHDVLTGDDDLDDAA